MTSVMMNNATVSMQGMPQNTMPLKTMLAMNFFANNLFPSQERNICLQIATLTLGDKTITDAIAEDQKNTGCIFIFCP